jgi:hypothetical protein
MMKRVRYFPGQLLSAADFETEQGYLESTRWPLPTAPKACYLTVALAERETDPVGDPAIFTRIDEGAVLAYEGREPPRTSPGPTRVALVRLVRSRRGWCVDSRYRTRRAR